jgi:FlaA1/EpsC-like NDP-sugar epimerase
MGEPVKIIDLAEKLIKQAGLIPYKDIDIEVVGLRPGEKLYEELLLDRKVHVPTANKKIFVEPRGEINSIPEEIESIYKLLDNKSASEIKLALKEVVDTYTIDNR